MSTVSSIPASSASKAADGQVEAGVVGVAAHEVGDLQREDTVEGVDYFNHLVDTEQDVPHAPEL